MRAPRLLRDPLPSEPSDRECALLLTLLPSSSLLPPRCPLSSSSFLLTASLSWRQLRVVSREEEEVRVSPLPRDWRPELLPWLTPESRDTLDRRSGATPVIRAICWS